MSSRSHGNPLCNFPKAQRPTATWVPKCSHLLSLWGIIWIYAWRKRHIRQAVLAPDGKDESPDCLLLNGIAPRRHTECWSEGGERQRKESSDRGHIAEVHERHGLQKVPHLRRLITVYRFGWRPNVIIGRDCDPKKNGDVLLRYNLIPQDKNSDTNLGSLTTRKRKLQVLRNGKSHPSCPSNLVWNI